MRPAMAHNGIYTVFKECRRRFARHRACMASGGRIIMFRKASTALGILLLSSSFAFAGQAPASTTAPNPRAATAKSTTVVKRKVRKAKKHKKHHKTTTSKSTTTKK
jgi:hypothetical protein